MPWWKGLEGYDPAAGEPVWARGLGGKKTPILSSKASSEPSDGSGAHGPEGTPRSLHAAGRQHKAAINAGLHQFEVSCDDKIGLFTFNVETNRVSVSRCASQQGAISLPALLTFLIQLSPTNCQGDLPVQRLPPAKGQQGRSNAPYRF